MTPDMSGAVCSTGTSTETSRPALAQSGRAPSASTTEIPGSIPGGGSGRTDTQADAVPKWMEEIDFCHIDDGSGKRTYCDAWDVGVDEWCDGEYDGEAVCPSCGSPTCPRCAQLEAIECSLYSD